MIIKIPTNWSEVSVLEFQQIALLDQNATPTQRIRDIISIVSGIDANNITLESLTEIQEMLSFMDKDISKERLTEITVDGVAYEWVKSLNQITLGEQISIEQTIENEELNYFESFDLIMSVLLVEKGKKFNANKINELRDFYGSFPIDKVYGIILFFLNGGVIYSRNTPKFSVLPKMKTQTDGQMKKSKLIKLSAKKVLLTVLSGLQWLTDWQKMTLQSMRKFLR